MLKGEIQEQLETQIQKKDGNSIWVLLQASVIRVEKEPLVQIISQDISARKALEEAQKNYTQVLKKEVEMKTKELIQSEKLASIGLLASGIAHEVNNPVMGIINYAQIIKDEIKKYKKFDLNLKPFSFLDGIIREGERIAKIVADLLTFSRKDTGEYVLADISEVINSSINLLNPKISSSQIDIQTNFQEKLPKIQMRTQNIQQVILNILQNSIDALDEKFGILNQEDSKKILIKTNLEIKQNKKYVKISIWDNGIGISSENLKKLFVPFFTTKKHLIGYSKIQGTGLGLSISYGIIKDHGGEIQIQSNWKENTTVEILLPSKHL